MSATHSHSHSSCTLSCAKNWKKRFFVLVKGEDGNAALVYSKKVLNDDARHRMVEAGTAKEERGRFNLRGGHVEHVEGSKYEHHFQITTSERAMQLRAESAEDLAAWLSALANAAKQRGGGPAKQHPSAPRAQ